MKLLLARLTRNKQGQIARTEETIEADAITVGRGADAKLHLPDPRVALQHATFRKSSNGKVSVDSEGATLVVDGTFTNASILRPGQKIQLGPYTIEVIAASEEFDFEKTMTLASATAAQSLTHDLVISLELTEPLPEQVQAKATDTKIGLNRTWLTKRGFSWVFFLLIGAAFLAWPVLHSWQQSHQQGAQSASASPSTPSTKSASTTGAPIQRITADQSWDPGPLDSGHASFGRDCSKCHTTPFVQTKNEDCESCHRTVGWHFPMETDAAKKIHVAVFSADESEGRCAACHRDHKGPNALKRQDSPMCTDCHGGLKTKHPEVGIPNVANLKTDHPPFKLSMLIPGKVGKDAIVRVSQSDKAKLVEKSNLKFPHDVHLDAKGVRGPNGRKVMECKNCHAPDETGTRFKPTTMKEHCQDCHSLEFEPKATTRQVPHGSVADVIATVNEFYAQAALFGKPIDQLDRVNERPGPHPNVGPTKNIPWVNQKAQTIVTEMMEKRACFACHEISRMGEGESQTWQIAPIAVTQHWLPKSRFPHIVHNTYECSKCHEVTKSKTSNDIAIPDLANCQSCHSGNDREADKAPGTCATCHGFHVGGSRAGKPVVLPKSMQPKPSVPGKTASSDVPPAHPPTSNVASKPGTYMHRTSSEVTASTARVKS
jgi:predicted CXXCH cytochrome family protein